MALLGPVHDGARRTARRLARSIEEGDDLFQEAALRALERLGDLRDEALFKAWFYRVLLSVHRNRARRAFWRRFSPLSVETDERGQVLDAATPAGEDGARWEDDRWRAKRLAAALATLPSEQREAVVLFELDGMSLEEVAALQQASLSAVKTRLSRGRERLRRHYREILDEEAVNEGPAAVAAQAAERRS